MRYSEFNTKRPELVREALGELSDSELTLICSLLDKDGNEDYAEVGAIIRRKIDNYKADLEEEEALPKDEDPYCDPVEADRRKMATRL